MFYDEAQGFLDERIEFPATARLIPCSVAQGIRLEGPELNCLFDVDTVVSANRTDEFPCYFPDKQGIKPVGGIGRPTGAGRIDIRG